MRQGYIWTFREGKAVRFRWFNDPEEALRAAGVDGLASVLRVRMDPNVCSPS